MKEKLQMILSEYGLTSSALADKMGIQRSGISHIMAGRNKPSYDFLVTLLEKFPDINANWLLADDENMYNDQVVNNSENNQNQAPGDLFPNPSTDITDNKGISREEDPAVYKSKQLNEFSTSEIESVIILKTNGSFKKYIPEN